MSNLILLQYTKEISIFAASFDYRLQLYNMKKITGKTYLDWYENMLLWRKFEDKLAAKYIQQKIRGFYIFIMAKRQFLLDVYIP